MTSYILRTGKERDLIDYESAPMSLEELIHIWNEDDNSGRTVFEKTTARELLSSICYMTPEENADEESEWIFELGKTHGWDTPLYRADYSREEGVYSPKPIAEDMAYIDAFEHDNIGARKQTFVEKIEN